MREGVTDPFDALLRIQEIAAVEDLEIVQAWMDKKIAAAVAAEREACAAAALRASYGPPSSWDGGLPKGWRHPPAWPDGRKPTPSEAAWHDNGARDAFFAIRARSTLQRTE